MQNGWPIPPSVELHVRLRSQSTVKDMVSYWLTCRKGEVKPSTWASYQQITLYIVGPLLVGSTTERCAFARRGVISADAKFVEMLGSTKISELSTAQIRQWQRTISELVSPYTAKVAKKQLHAALQFAAEDFDIPVPRMPSNRGRGASSRPKSILMPAQVGRLLAIGLTDEAKGIYYTFPFLTGVRPSEQLGLLWEDVDLDAT